MQIPDPQIPKPARPLSPAERKRQRPAEVNTVLAIAGGDSRIEISTLTDDQNALHIAKVNELLNMDKFNVVAVFDRPQSHKFSQHAAYQNRDLMDPAKKDLWHEDLNKRSVQIQISTLERQSSRLCAHYSRSLQFTEIQLLLETVTVRIINHRCQVNQNQWSQHRKHSWTLPRYGFARKLFKDSRFILNLRRM